MEEDAQIEAAAPAVLQSNDQKHLKEFILVLETLPEVWDSSNANSQNKVKRANAYEQLLEIFKKIKPAASTKDVIAKINSLKSNYRKEFKKITDSKRSGAAAEHVYEPKSWVFHMLKFLNKNEKPIDVNEFSELDRSENEDQHEPSFSSMSETAPPSKKLKNKGPIARQNDLLEKACSYLSQSSPQPVSPTNIDPIALYWSHKLKKLKTTQRLLAEKAINEILFEAELETLNRDSVQINTAGSPVLKRFVSPTSNSYASPSPIYVHPPTPSPINSNSVTLQSPQSVTSPENFAAASPQTNVAAASPNLIITNTNNVVTNDVPSVTEMYDSNVITSGVPSNLIITNTNNVRRRETSYTLHIPSTSSTDSDYTVGTLFSSYQGE